MRKVWSRAHRNAAALDRRWDHLVVVREPEGVRRRDHRDLQRAVPDIPFRPWPTVADRLEIETNVVRKICGTSKGVCSIVRKRWRTNREDLAVREPLAVWGIGSSRDEADRQIQLLTLKVRSVVRCRDPHVDSGMEPVESGQSGREPKRGESSCGGDREGLARFGNTTCCRIDQGQGFVGSSIKLFPGAGELQCAVNAPKKRLADLLFEGLDLTADCRLSDMQFLSRARETQVTRRGPEASEQIERQAWLPALGHVGQSIAAGGAVSDAQR